MPFDGLTSALLQRDSLSHLLADLGIEPVSQAVLDAHKIAEIEKHPPSRFWRHQELYQIISLLSPFVLIVLTLGASLTFASYAYALATLMLGIVPSLYLLGRALVGVEMTMPAQWIEDKYSRYSAPMPEPIKKLAEKIADEDRSVFFVVGKLIQRQVVLDPYLLVKKMDSNGEYTCHCLGIWDDDKIIHIARSN